MAVVDMSSIFNDARKKAGADDLTKQIPPAVEALKGVLGTAVAHTKGAANQQDRDAALGSGNEQQPTAPKTSGPGG